MENLASQPSHRLKPTMPHQGPTQNPIETLNASVETLDGRSVF